MDKLHMGCVSKGPDQVSQMINLQYKLQILPFKVIPLESLSRPSLPRLHALLKGIFRDPVQLRRHNQRDVIQIFKMGQLDDPFGVGMGGNHTFPCQMNSSRYIQID